MTEPTARRLLLVHAHPDDETITTGATMARYAASGARVTLVTCTRGEEGEVAVGALAHLAAGHDDALGAHREGELAAAMAELGVTDHRFLGGAGRYRDSGMIGTPPNERPDCFWRTDPREAAGHLAAVIREVRPQVVVTYDPDGGYGHPDHVQAHRVTTLAVALAADPGYRPGSGTPHRADRVFWVCVSRPVVEERLAALAATGELHPFEGIADVAEVSGVVGAAEVDVVVDAGALVARKAAALRAHATQVVVDGDRFALTTLRAQPILATEYFRLADGVPLGGDAPGDDLFAGLPVPAAGE